MKRLELDKVRICQLLIFVGLSLLILFARLYTWDEPLERDIGVYAVIAHEMLIGRELYSDLFDHKPPAVHVTFALGEMLVGYGPQSICLMNFMAAFLTLLGVYYAGMAISNSRSGGIWAALFWAIISSDLSLQANQPNVEVFINVCLIWVFVSFVSAERSMPFSKVIIAGILLSVASLYKQITLVAGIAFSLAYIRSWSDQSTGKKVDLHLTVMALIGIAVWGGTAAYFVFKGNFDAFYEAVFVYNREYMKAGSDSIGSITRLFQSFPWCFSSVLPLFFASIIGVLIAYLRRSHCRFYLLAYFVAVPVMILLPNQYFPHYYQLWLPLLCVSAAVTAVELGISFTSVGGIWHNITKFAGIFIAISLLFYQLPSFSLSADEWSYKKYGGIFNIAKGAAEIPGRLLLPSESFYQFGAEPTLYFYSKRSPPSGLFFFYPLLQEKFAEKYSKRAISDLENTMPELVMFGVPTSDLEADILEPSLRAHPVVEWISTHYHQMPDLHPALWVRNGGALEERLLNPESSPAMIAINNSPIYKRGGIASWGKLINDYGTKNTPGK